VNIFHGSLAKGSINMQSKHEMGTVKGEQYLAGSWKLNLVKGGEHKKNGVGWVGREETIMMDYCGIHKLL